MAQLLGNTKCRNWCLTINNFTEEEEEMVKKQEKYIYQEELGTENTKHLQILIWYKNAKHFNVIKRMFPRAHIEKCNNKKASEKYCCKTESRVRGPYSNYINFPKDPLKGKELYNWQKEIIEIIKGEPDERKIYWYYEKVGNRGKTSLAKHICLNNEDTIYISGKAKDMKYAITMRELENKKTKTCILDFARTRENYISYEGIEEIKNGIFFNTKYESKMIIMDTPHIIIFANYEPEIEALSLDRWVIREIQ